MLKEQDTQETQWSKIWLVAHGSEAEKQAALQFLCSLYRYPIYSYVRKHGAGAEDSEDLTQGFFAQLLQRNTFADADPSRGRLRNFLFTLLQRYVSTTHAKARAIKRGGGVVHVSLDLAEQRYKSDASHDLSPDRLFQRQWAITLMERALEATAAYARRHKNTELFELFRSRLGLGPRVPEKTESFAAAHGMKDGAVRTALTRMSQRFNHYLFEEVAQTIERNDRAEILAEISELRSLV